MSPFFLLACLADPRPGADLPQEGFISATGAALGEMAGCLERFAGSEAAEVAIAWRGLAVSCPGEIFGAGPDAWRNLRCVSPPDPVRVFRGGAALAFGWGDAGRLVGRGTLWGGAAPVRAEAWLSFQSGSAVGALAVPGAEPAGPSVLADEGAILHVRARPADGIDVSGLVESGSQADSLFGLKGALLSRAVLAGDWELAAYPPEPGGELPVLALAVGVREPAAGPAIEAFVAGVAEKWSVQRSVTSVEGVAGECLAGLRILPQLEPCYARTRDQLVVAWNRDALGRALAPGAARLAGETALVATIDFDAMAEADAVVAASRPPGSVLPPLSYPLRRVEVQAEPEGDELKLTARSLAGCSP
ncbi:MAG: hypothetical protein FJ090_06090 [Deltaproteobacteria bacterium]|nr:hypothetical protein [Deltaproteobacteria bacterium]MBM4390674.1 hypothetical protein [Deltaproteobacteria bacterium]